MVRLPLLLACLCLALVAAACGDDEEQPAAAPTPEPAGTIAPDSISTDLTTKPPVEKPAGSPPAALVAEDVVKGTGKTARAGDLVAMQYVGVSWSTGEQFDASWDRGEPLAFPLGAGKVIPGWDQGIAGMKEGGRRLLVIPPDLAYGDQSPTPAIAPGETLVFVVDLVKVKR